MKVTVKKMSTPHQIVIEIPKEEYLEAIEKHFKKIQPNLEIKGFRKGKATREIAQQNISPNILYKPIIDKFIFDSLKENNIDVVSWGEIFSYGKFDGTTDITIKTIIELYPQIIKDNIDTINLPYPELKLSNTEIEEEISNRIVKYNKTFVLPENEKFQDKDIFEINYKGFIDEKQFDNGSAKNFQYIVGETKFIGNFNEQLITMEKGETKEIKVQFPDNYNSKSLAGKKATFITELKNIKRIEKAELNDDIAVKEGFENSKDMRDTIIQEVESIRSGTIEHDFRYNIFQEIIKVTEITPLPKTFVRTHLENGWSNLMIKINKTPKEFVTENKEDLITKVKKSKKCSYEEAVVEAIELAKEEYFDTNYTNMENELKLRITLDNYVEKEKMNISKEEMIKKVKKKFKNFSMNDIDIKLKLDKILANENEFNETKKAILRDIAIEKIIEIKKCS